jgi:hypothetical protein
VHRSGSGEELVVDSFRLTVRGELESDVHGVDGGGSSAGGNLSSTSGDAPRFSSLGLVRSAVTVKMVLFAAVAAGPKLCGPFELTFLDVLEAGTFRILAARAASRWRIRSRIVPILVFPILGRIRRGSAVVLDAEPATIRTDVGVVANATTLSARLASVNDGANHGRAWIQVSSTVDGFRG